MTSWKLILPCTRAEAEALNDDLSPLSLMEPPPALMTLEPDEALPEAWEAHVFFETRPDKESIALIQSLIPSAAVAIPRLEQLPDEDWVTASQQGLAPVHAGRFYVHTATNRGKVPTGAICFQIEASRAFGTGGHETTEGCLWMLDALRARGQRFENVADIGTGTGLLAFAGHTLWPRAYVTASDIDPVSIDVTIDNAAINAVPLGQHPGYVALCVAPGTDHEMIQRRAPYDLVIANILAGPLIELAPSISEIVVEGGTLILAGLLEKQRGHVVRAYAKSGFRLTETRPNGDWPCLRLIKRRAYGWQRPTRATGLTSQAPGDFGTW